MGRKNKRIQEELYLPPIKEDKRSMPRCPRFPDKTVFTTGYRAQIAVDEIKARSTRDKIPQRVYECKVAEGGCGFFHTTSEKEFRENHNGEVPVARSNDYSTSY